MAERNPTLLPKPIPAEERQRRCPACKGIDFGGFKCDGVITFTCRNPQCKTQWSGGLPREPYDPFLPRPVEPTPIIDYGMNPKTGQVEEVRQRQPLTPEYRKGALVDPDEEENQ